MSADIPKWEWLLRLICPDAKRSGPMRSQAVGQAWCEACLCPNESPETTWEHFHHQPPPSVTVNMLCVQTHTALDCTSGINTVQCYISCPLGWLFIGIRIYGTDTAFSVINSQVSTCLVTAVRLVLASCLDTYGDLLEKQSLTALMEVGKASETYL